MTEKYCYNCKRYLVLINFYKNRSAADGYKNICKDCSRILLKQYRKNNSDKVSENRKKHYKKNAKKLREMAKAWSKKNKNKKKQIFKKWYEKNKDAFLAKKRKERKTATYRQKARQYYRKNVLINLKFIVSSSIRNALKREKGSKAGQTILDRLPYSLQDLKEHLERQFEPWMNWDNHGTYKINGKRVWHIDHIIPQKQLPYDSLEHVNFLKCWELNNLRPLEATLNLQKGSKMQEREKNEH